MRQAADILSSAPAMQIRYLEAMQHMAKSAHSKVIFLPAANAPMTDSAAFKAALSNTDGVHEVPDFSAEFGSGDYSFSQAKSAGVVETI